MTLPSSSAAVPKGPAPEKGSAPPLTPAATRDAFYAHIRAGLDAVFAVVGDGGRQVHTLGLFVGSGPQRPCLHWRVGLVPTTDPAALTDPADWLESGIDPNVDPLGAAFLDDVDHTLWDFDEDTELQAGAWAFQGYIDEVVGGWSPVALWQRADPHTAHVVGVICQPEHLFAPGTAPPPRRPRRAPGLAVPAVIGFIIACALAFHWR